jgi:mRNA interferase HigB
MKVHLVTKRNLKKYALQNSGARIFIKKWMIEVQKADWASPNDILNSYVSADLLGNGSNRVVFDLGGNNYRMICQYWFGEINVHLFVRWIGTHAEYNELCKRNGQFNCKEY